jgi:Xaa-Pro dipeptidase
MKELSQIEEDTVVSKRGSNQHDILIERMRAHDLEALALVPGPNLYYVTGLSFHLSERPILAILKTDGARAIVLPVLEAAKVTPADGLEVFPYTDEQGPGTALRKACDALGLGESRLGAEGLRLRLLEVQLLERHASGCRLVTAEDVLGDLRMRKEEHELGRMRSAVSATQEALAAFTDLIEVGATETELASILRMELLRAGGDEIAFSPIVVAGPNAALPHATPGERPVGPGDCLIVDCGASVGGYIADITRTFVVGEPDPELTDIYSVVQAANRAGRAAVRPDVPAEEIDRAARQVIEDAGYGEYFIHRTGHGIGLEVHEPPYIVAGNRELLEPGMTFTVEPGIYLPGRGGVRIEDDVLVTLDGGETLSTFPRELMRLSE